MSINRHDPHDPITPHEVIDLPGDLKFLSVGVMNDRPDGAVELQFVRRDQTAVTMEVGWRIAAQVAVAIFAAGVKSSDRAGVSVELWKAHIDAAWAATGRRMGGVA